MPKHQPNRRPMANDDSLHNKVAEVQRTDLVRGDTDRFGSST